MPHTPQMAEYVMFMEWLQETHPDLYFSCWKSIAVPADGEGLTIVKDGMDDETYKAVIEVTREYYRKKHD